MEIIVRFQVHEKLFVDANSRFSKDVFLSSKSMRDQLKLIGVSYETKVIQSLFQWRNAISHTYCRIVIRHASFDAVCMLAVRWKREISLEYLTEENFVPLTTTDEYF